MSAFLIEFHGGPLDGEVRQVPYFGRELVVTLMEQPLALRSITYRYLSFIELDDLVVAIAQNP